MIRERAPKEAQGKTTKENSGYRTDKIPQWGQEIQEYPTMQNPSKMGEETNSGGHRATETFSKFRRGSVGPDTANRGKQRQSG